MERSHTANRVGARIVRCPDPAKPNDILVRNSCRVGSLDGEESVAEGRARVTDPKTNAKLSVTFGGLFGAPYWIIDLDPTLGDEPYRWAVVSDPTQTFLWILSRTPKLEEEVKTGIRDRLEEQGFDLERLRWTPQQEVVEG